MGVRIFPWWSTHRLCKPFLWGLIAASEWCARVRRSMSVRANPVRICVCICIFICIRICICICICVCIHISVCVCACMLHDVFVRSIRTNYSHRMVRPCEKKYVREGQSCAYVYVCVHIYMCVYIYIYIHTHTHTYIYECVYVCYMMYL